MKRFIPLLLAALCLAAPGAPAIAEVAPAATESSAIATTLREALHSGEWDQVRRCFHDPKSPVVSYLAARWDDMRAGRLDPLQWEVSFDPYRSDAFEATGQLSIAARLKDGSRVGHRFDVAIVRLGNAWLVDEPIAYDRVETRLAGHALSLDLRKPGALSATDALTLEATGPDRAVYLRLHPAMQVSAVRWGGQALPFVQKREVLYFERPDGVGPFVISVSYTGTLPASDWDFVRSGGSVLRSEFLWYPRPAVGGSFTPYTVSVQVPAGHQAVAVGDLSGVDKADDGWTYRYEAKRPVEGMSVYSGAYQRAEAVAGGIEVTTYTGGDRKAEVPMYLAEAAHVLDFYGDRFGHYPYRKLALVETDFPGGYGATSAVALPHVAFDRPAVADEFLAHEIAHNWTDMVAYQGALGERGFMAEGVASYLDLLYHGARDGAQGFRHKLQEAHRRYMGILGSAEDVPIAEASQDDRRLWQLLTYDKAAIVLHMLRREIGEKAFDQGLKNLYARKAGQTIGIDDFEASFSQAYGQNLGYFFRQWLSRPGVPMIEAEALHVKPIGGDKYELDGVLSQRTMPFILSVPLVVVSDKGQMVYSVPVRAFHTPFRLRVPGKPRVFLIDPLRDALLVGSPPASLR